MQHPDGSATGQVKPAPGSVTDADGDVLKYVSPKTESNPPKLPVLRQVENPSVVLIVEGVKQALAALAWAPADWSIYRITGIWSWLVAGEGDEHGAPTSHLAEVHDQNVVIVPDADAGTNAKVFDGADALGKACSNYGAKSVKFAQLPGGGKDGLDDVLKPHDEGKRSGLLKSWVNNAKSKPADLTKGDLTKLRAAQRRKNIRKQDEASGDKRVVVNIDGDRLGVVRELVGALKDQRAGKSVFRVGGSLVRLRRTDDELQSAELDLHGLHNELLQVTRPRTIKGEEGGDVEVPRALLGVVADRWDEFPLLAGISRSPVVRPDGTILAENGYDEETKLVMELTDDVIGIDVPEHPSDTDIASARNLLRDDLFAMDGAGGYDGWVFEEVADQTNAIAALLTPPLRAFTGPTPMYLFDGIQRGVGKNEAIEVIHLVNFGTSAPVQPAPSEGAEMGKRLTASYLGNNLTFVLDEVQKEEECCLDSRELSAALTSRIYSSRELGKSRALNLPNLMTFFASGNNVQVPADMARRVCPIRLSSDRPNLENRDNFRLDLGTWIPEHRRELLRACLTLIRAWFDRGQPAAPKDFGFASFSRWQAVVGGILHLAGFEDFLGNVMEVRETTDSEAVDNREHWEWVEEKFPAGQRFSVSDVLVQARKDVDDAPPPYDMSWEKLAARKLSMYYGLHRKWYGDLRIKADGTIHGKKKAYVVERLSTGAAAESVDGSGEAPSNSVPASRVSRPAAGAGPDETIQYQDRNGFTVAAARAMPEMEGTTISELGGGS
nr:DUF3854 domain-containing protein [Nesterenkonia sp. Act20]